MALGLISLNILSSDMKRFVFALCGLSVVMLLIIVAMHVVAVYNLRSEVEAAYTIKAGVDTLFIGSSQVGCSIVEAPEFHNQVLWISDTISPSFLMRLKEFERRGQLDKVKMLVVPFNLISAMMMEESKYMWGWYQELAVSRRYLDMLPCNKFQFCLYILRNLRYPFHIHVKDSPPRRNSIVERPKSYQEKYYDSVRRDALARKDIDGRMKGGRDQLISCHREMKNICDRHGVRLIVYQPPLMKIYTENLSQAVVEQEQELIRRLKSLGIEYVATSRDYPNSCFFDYVHMVKSGAYRFTINLYRRLGLEIK